MDHWESVSTGVVGGECEPHEEIKISFQKSQTSFFSLSLLYYPMISETNDSPSPGLTDLTQTRLTTSGTELTSSHKDPLLVTNSGSTLDKDLNTLRNSTQPSQGAGHVLTPGHQGVDSSGGNDVSVLFCTNISTELDYEDLYLVFKQYGAIERMKLRLSANKKRFVFYILYNSNNSASKACRSMNGHLLNEFVVEAKLCSRDRFHKEPHDFIPEDLGYSGEAVEVDRTPPLPIWYVATYREGMESIVGAAKCIQRKVGKLPFDNLKRYGKNILIKASDETQAELLSKFKAPSTGNIKSITPHKSFNTPKGVIYSKDLACFSEEEILEMCPHNVYQVRKLRGANSAILLTFSSTFLPDYITFDHLRVKVKQYRARPIQCYNCYEYGHVVTHCTKSKKCIVCSQHHQEWDKCELPSYCFHCSGNHSPTSRDCPRKKFEQEVVEVAQNQHISIGSAKRQVMAANKDPTSSYASAIKRLKTSTNQSDMKRSISDNSKTSKRISKEVAMVAEALNLTPISSSKASGKGLNTNTSPLSDDESDSLPKLGQTEMEEDINNELDPQKTHDIQPITVETNSSVITVTKKKKHDNDGFTVPNDKKRARPVSPKDGTKVKTSNKFQALEETPASKRKTVSEGASSSDKSSVHLSKQHIYEGPQTKEHRSQKERSDIEISKETSKVKSVDTTTRIPVNSANQHPSNSRRKLSIDNFGATPKEKGSQPENRSGKKH